MIYHDISGDRTIDPYDLSDLPETVAEITEALRTKRRYWDSIVVTGLSGVVVGVPVALALDKPVVILRKPDDDSHHGKGRFVNEVALGKRALFLDDFVSCGTTINRVKEKVAEKGGRVVARYLYRDRDYAKEPK